MPSVPPPHRHEDGQHQWRCRIPWSQTRTRRRPQTERRKVCVDLGGLWEHERQGQSHFVRRHGIHVNPASGRRGPQIDNSPSSNHEHHWQQIPARDGYFRLKNRSQRTREFACLMVAPDGTVCLSDTHDKTEYYWEEVKCDEHGNKNKAPAIQRELFRASPLPRLIVNLCHVPHARIRKRFHRLVHKSAGMRAGT